MTISPQLHALAGPLMALWSRWRRRSSLLLGALAMVACGGGNQVDEPASFKLLPDDLVGAPCAQCRDGYLVGMAADGLPLADAQVLLVDAGGRTAQGRSDAQGRYAVLAAGLSGPMLVQVSGFSGAEPVLWHSVALAIDVSNRAVNVTPLTELISAFVLGGAPQDLRQQGRLDFMRISATSLRSNQDRVKHLLLPALTLAQAQNSDLRTAAFGARHTGLEAAGSLFELQRLGGGYSLHSALAAGADSQQGGGLLVDPVASSSDAVLAPYTPGEAGSAQAALLALADIELQLRQFSALFSAGLPSAEALAPWLAEGFRHTGLDAAGFISQVLLRQDAPEPGAFNLKGARFERPRLLQIDGNDRLLLRLQVSSPVSADSYSETLWMVRSGGRWLWQGDGQAGLLRLRHLAVLGAKPRDKAELLAMPGMQCSAAPNSQDEQCRIEGGQGDVAAGGVLDFGSPNSEQFGHIAHYRSDAPTWQQRLNASRTLTRLSATPSAEVSRHLAFEVDSRRLDPRTQRVRVNGPGLPEQGLELVVAEAATTATTTATAKFRFLALSERPDQDWHAVRSGRCVGGADRAADSPACQAAWAKVGVGSRYRFDFIDQAGQVLHTQSARLPSNALSEEELLARKAELFARFELQATPAQQPLYARVLDPARQAQALHYSWAWQGPSAASQRLLGATVELHLADPSSGEQRLHTQAAGPAALLRADGSRVWDLASTPGSSPAGLPVWLSARLTTADANGNHYVHYIAPNNPY